MWPVNWQILYLPWRGKDDCPGMPLWVLLAAFSWDRPVWEAICGGGVIVKGAGPIDEEEEDAEKAPVTEDAWDNSGDSKGVSISKK